MRPFIIMAMVLVEVALWQWRVAVTGRGHYLRGAALGGIGAVIQITVVLRLVGDVGGAASIAGYAAGVALGVAAGGVLDHRATPQLLKVQVIAASGHGLPTAVRAGGWPVTQFAAHGDDQEALDVITVAIDARQLPMLEEAVDLVSPDAVWIIERVHRGRGLDTPALARIGASRAERSDVVEIAGTPHHAPGYGRRHADDVDGAPCPSDTARPSGIADGEHSVRTSSLTNASPAT